MADTATRTFRGPGGAGLPNLTGLPGVVRTESALPEVIETELLDTDDYKLAAAGIRLGLHRTSSGPGQWRLELPDETFRVTAGESSDVPAELVELARGAARDATLRPVGSIRTVRTENRLLGEDDRVLATLVHDEVTVATMGSRADVRGWAGIDVRPGAGADGLLDDIEARLGDTGMRRGAPEAVAELHRMLRPAPWPGVGPKGSAGAAVMDYVARQVDRIAAEELRVRRDGPDAVHKMRVAARRLRSALKAHRRVLDRQRTEPIADALRELGRSLAPARDAEVLRERIEADLAALPAELVLGPVQAEATRHFARVEAEARAAVLAALDSPAHQELRRALDDLLEHPPLRSRAEQPARQALRTGRTERRLRRAMTAALDGGGDTELHTARKATKRLRYATEVTGTRPRKLKALQKALGHHQDVVVARPVLRGLGAAAAENGFTFGLLLGRADARAAAIEEQLPELWRRVRKNLG
jgi:CHAD domain-containing protein